MWRVSTATLCSLTGRERERKRKKREKKPDIPELEHPKSLGQLDFTVELIKESGGIDKNTEVPLYSLKKPQPPLPPPPPLQTRALLPKWSEKYKNCKCCYSRKKKEKKTYVTCATCEQHFYCFTTKRNCFGGCPSVSKVSRMDILHGLPARCMCRHLRL